MSIQSSIKKSFNKLNRIIFIFLILWTLPANLSFSQTKTNLQIFYNLADSAANYVLKQIPSRENSCKVNLNLGSNYSVLGNKILSRFIAGGKKVNPNSIDDSSSIVVDFTIDKTEVKYEDMYRKGLFGDFYVPRMIKLSGNFLVLPSGSKMHDFNYTYSDSVKVDDVRSLENTSYTFTQGQLPPEPFFSSLFEPVIAVGATALAVILFFTIRSK